MKVWILSCLLGFSHVITPMISAQEQYETNLREACRVRVAGLYLTVLDRVRIAEASIEFHKEQRKKLGEELDKVRLRLGAIEPEIENDFYEIDLREEKAELLATVSRIELALQDSQASLQSIEKDVMKFRQDEEALKQQILLLFVIRPITGSGLGYPFRIEYQDSCPPYNESCNLSPARARLLPRVFEGYEVPEVCRKFAAESH